MNGRIFYVIVFILVVLMGIFLAWQNHRLRSELLYCNKVLKHTGSTNIDLKHLEKIVDMYILSKLNKFDYKWKLVVIYAPEDCPPCLDEINYWAEMYGTEKKFGLFGLVNHPYTELVLKYNTSMGWNFPVVIVKENAFGENFGFKKTPIKILLNEKNQVYFVEGPLPDWKKNGKLKALIIELLK